jgi:hypothetical protein
MIDEFSTGFEDTPMSNKKYRRGAAQRWTRRTGPDADGYLISENSPFFDDEVRHPFLDDYGAPVTYMSRKSGERMLDLKKPSGEHQSVPMAELVLRAHQAESPAPGHVPCFRDGHVLNCELANLYWGAEDDPKSALSLRRDGTAQV